MSRYQLVERERGSHSVALLCRTLVVSPARSYAWRKQPRPAPALPPAQDWQEALKQAFGQHKRCYGTRRLRTALHAQGHRVGRQRLWAAYRTLLD